MSPSDALFSRRCKKNLDRASYDLERAAARHGLSVTAIHDLAPGLADCRIYEICNAERAREAFERHPEAAILVPCRILLACEEGGTRLTAVRPQALLGALPGLAPLAAEMEESVRRTLEEAARE